MHHLERALKLAIANAKEVGTDGPTIPPREELKFIGGVSGGEVLGASATASYDNRRSWDSGATFGMDQLGTNPGTECDGRPVRLHCEI